MNAKHLIRASTTTFRGKYRCVCGVRIERDEQGDWEHNRQTPTPDVTGGAGAANGAGVAPVDTDEKLGPQKGQETP